MDNSDSLVPITVTDENLPTWNDEEVIDPSELTTPNNRRVLMDYLADQGFRPKVVDDGEITVRISGWIVKITFDWNYMTLLLSVTDSDWFEYPDEFKDVMNHINSTKKLVSVYNEEDQVVASIGQFFESHTSMTYNLDVKLEWLGFALRSFDKELKKRINGNEESDQVQDSESFDYIEFDLDDFSGTVDDVSDDADEYLD